MNAYIYAADMYCEECGKDIKKRITAEGFAPEHPDDETTYDSGEFPKGPFSDGGGTSDSPCHCASGADCLQATEIAGEKYGCFLENDLTEDGVNYLKEKMTTDPDSEVVKFWVDHYSSNGYDISWPKPPQLVICRSDELFFQERNALGIVTWSENEPHIFDDPHEAEKMLDWLKQNALPFPMRENDLDAIIIDWEE